MENKVNIFFFEQLAGELSQDKYGMLSFQYNQEYIAKNGVPISHSMPLTSELYYGNEAHAYFTGLLPEEDVLASTARVMGTSSLNYFKLLVELGKEPVGAIRIGDSTQPSAYQYEEISMPELDEIIIKNDSLLSTLYREKGMRLSLAGAQSKTGLYYRDGRYFIPQNGSPSNIIVKPANKRFQDLVFNEYACLKIAASLGISIPAVQLVSTPSQHLFAIERYDRFLDNENLKRLHQEDFCQALRIQVQNKYQSDGGPDFSRCIDLLRKATTVPAIEINKFISLFVYNLIIGNKDAHGKNYSILHRNNTSVLAPAYDVLSTTYYPELSEKMSMSINGKFELDEITEDDLYQMAQSSNISGKLVLKEYHRIKDGLLPQATKVLSETTFSDTFRTAFFEHFEKMHAQLPF
jgi:serine/threonine-protein kinase HipA